MMKMTKIMYIGAAMLLLLPLVAGAATVLNDTFTDGDRTDGTDAQDTAWFSVCVPIVSVGTDTTLTNGNTLSLTTASTSTSIFRRLVGEFTTQSLTNVGDKITLSLDFRMASLGTTGNTNRGFKVGLFNTNGSSMTADGTSSAEPTSSTPNATSNDTGYFVGIGTGTTGTTALMREDGIGATFMAGTDIAYLTSSTGTSPQIQDLLAHSLTFTITKDSETTLQIDFNLDGGDIDLTSTGGSTLITSFNEVGFSTGSYQTGFVIDNVNVEFIPEPATIALLSLGFFALRRRKN